MTNTFVNSISRDIYRSARTGYRRAVADHHRARSKDSIFSMCKDFDSVTPPPPHIYRSCAYFVKEKERTFFFLS